MTVFGPLRRYLVFGRFNVLAETPVRSAWLPLLATPKALSALSLRLSISRTIIFGFGWSNTLAPIGTPSLGLPCLSSLTLGYNT